MTDFQIGMAAAIPAIPLPAPLHMPTALVNDNSKISMTHTLYIVCSEDEDGDMIIQHSTT